MIDQNTRNKVTSDNKKLDVHTRIEYERRLSLPYIKKGLTSSFMDQFLNGSGSELKSKFWSRISSSRLAFDLYSWLANEDQCVDIQMEFKLPGIISMGHECPANMDVMIETNSEIWFIESKFTEVCNNRDYSETLPGAYWETIQNDNTSDWYHNSKGELRKYPLIKRFRGREEVANKFQAFCNYIANISKNIPDNEAVDWFDAKQETCHLFGIIMYILENHPTKKVVFSNIVYNFNPEIENRSKFANQFIKKAQALVDDIVGDNKFEYKTNFIQDVLLEYGDKIAYGTDSTPIKSIIEKNFPIII